MVTDVFTFLPKSSYRKTKGYLAFLIICLIGFGFYSKDFKLDASSDTLLLENDPDLQYLREVTNRYGSKEFLVLTYTPDEPMVSEKSLNNLLSLKYKIQSFDWVHSVITLLDVPLLNNSEKPLAERLKNISTLKDDDVDKERGFKEILNSPVFRNFVISEDGKTTGLIVNIKEDKKLKDTKGLTDEEIENLKEIRKKNNHNNILEIRETISTYNNVGNIFLGGIPMIADDMMTFIKNDIIVFGIGVIIFIVTTLWLVFKKIIWIIVPISSCFFSVVIMTGLLGLLNWKVTVISSNFIALMLILTMAMNIHLSTRFLQIKKNFPNKKLGDLIFITMSKMFWPIIYTVLTTVCAFLSLIFSEIRPIIDFGWMMTMGLFVSFLISFTLLPSLLNIFSKFDVNLKKENNSKITSTLSQLSINNKKIVLVTSVLIIVLSIFGISKLEVENSFINYFSKDTEIYKGMKLIDDKLGGTTPLDIILKFPQKEEDKKNTDDEDEFEDWDDGEDESSEKYWFTKDKIDKINSVHNYLDSLPFVGKVLSLTSILDVATQLNDGKTLETLEIGVLYSKIPDTIKQEVIDPYISIKDNEARISLRIKDSDKELRRNDLINKINYDLENELNLNKNEFKLAGVLILFNNLLQSLFKSQILTLGFVMMLYLECSLCFLKI